jgi:hypothetical protein
VMSRCTSQPKSARGSCEDHSFFEQPLGFAQCPLSKQQQCPVPLEQQQCQVPPEQATATATEVH